MDPLSLAPKLCIGFRIDLGKLIDQFIYKEIGQLYCGTDFYLATRCYVYKPKGSILHVKFEDGHDFFELDCALLPNIQLEHVCGQDRYFGEFSIHRNEWQMQWQVLGPKKDFMIKSFYRPINLINGEAHSQVW